MRVALPALYVAVGRRLGYPLWIVQAKEHLFARWEQPGGDRFNIECTSRGFLSHEDREYHDQPRPLNDEELASGQFLRNLTPREELSLFLRERGHCLLDNLRFFEAADAYYLADQLAPDMPGAANAYPVAMALWNVLIASKNRARAEGKTRFEPEDLRVPNDAPDWLRAMTPMARTHVNRILRIHLAKADAGNPTKEYLNFCKL